MTTRVRTWKRALVALGMSGSVLPFWGWGCVTNEGLTNFYQNFGNNAIETATSPASAIGSDFDALVVDPTTAFLQSMWSTYVRTRVPQDPQFSRLVVE